MGRRQKVTGTGCFVSLVILLMGLIPLTLAYMFMSWVLTSARDFPAPSDTDSFPSSDGSALSEQNGGCCGGIENFELWGTAVKWGTDFKFNSSEDCCKACKVMCSEHGGPCLCDSWVFCGNKEACGTQFGECWLKKQKDSLSPERQAMGPLVKWTSGLIFGKGEAEFLPTCLASGIILLIMGLIIFFILFLFLDKGIVGLETEYGTIHIKLFPDCAPHSIEYILELLALRQCAGCHFYRAESRGAFWDSKGKHVKNAPFGPPFALIQGTLAAQGTAFPNIPTEVCPTIRRGSVAWIGSGPEFFISLANHEEWKNAYTVFGSVILEDMAIAERIAQLPTHQMFGTILRFLSWKIPFHCF